MEAKEMVKKKGRDASEATGESLVAVATEVFDSSEKASPVLGWGQPDSEGGFPGVASRSSGGPEVALDEHAGLDNVVVETRSILTSTNDLRNIWELFFAPFEREILSALKARNHDGSFVGYSFDFYIVPARPDECVLDGPPDSFPFYLYPMLEGGVIPPLLNLRLEF
ncbi:uncharacterized protein G2W53_041794 [Senna tora]|uniref:Uncharacterized protein n=1 Tax=Senna tora TaxID=362788 RepID=A0A834VYC0_9FABA|nr:uncharacterized protein G2W53_041794 [Senna tora]